MENQKPGILCFSSTDWTGIWGSRQQVMQRFAKRGYQVLYIEQLAGLEHLLRYPALLQRKQKRWREGLIQVEANLWIASAPPLFPGRYYARCISKLNARLVVRWAVNLLQAINFLTPILWLYKPEHSDLIGHFNESLVIYHCIDEWTAGTSGRKRHTISLLDHSLVNRADLVFANSQPTYENKLRINPNTYRIPSGVDVDLFEQARSPAVSEYPALVSIPKPRIGYIGTINERLDYTYLEHLVQSRPDWHLVLAGDTYPWRMDAPELQKLSSYPSVHFLGLVPYQQLPPLLKGIDVGLVPYVGDERGFYRSPLKLYEYLAAGLPIVATDHPEVREFASIARIAANPAEFIDLITEALAEDGPAEQERRIQIARQHTWDKRVDQMEDLIRVALRNQR